MNEQRKIEAEELAQEEREAMEEMKRKQVKLEEPMENPSPVNGIPGDVKFVRHRILYCILSLPENMVLSLGNFMKAVQDRNW
jgi:hypothetical protein